MINKIKILSKDLINKIAAGEVIERPSSIVKELIENSIDANSDEIKIILDNSGLDSITIIDNGLGMSREDIEKSVLQHATSKITKEEDLFNILTLGFRGEALASISSIADLTIHSHNGIESPNTLECINGQTKISQGPARVRGTTIKVSKIFSNIPARRKFLKSELTEYKYILETIYNIAISHNKVKFSLIKNNKNVFELNKNEKLINRINDIYKSFKQNDLLELNFNDGYIQINGYISTPSYINQNTSKQYIYVNNRFIKAPLIQKAVKEGYSTSIMPNFNPSYFLFININPKEIDVNVHPRKLEIRFEDNNRLFKTIKNLINKRLEIHLKENLNKQFNSFETPNNNNNNNNNSEIGLPFINKNNIYSQKQYNTFGFKTVNSINKSIEFTKALLDEKSFSFNSYNYIQIFNTYIIIEKNNKLLIIDQHAAAERINFEKIENNVNNNKNNNEELLIAEKVSISKNEEIIIRENINLFKKIGFEFLAIKSTYCEISHIPYLLQKESVLIAFKELLDELKDNASNNSAIWENKKNKIIATIACHNSIRAGQKLNREEVENLITDLFNCKIANSCPHGRPIFWEIEKEEIEKKFKRII